MLRLRALLAPILLCLAPVAHAGGLVQISLEGRVDRAGGARIEIAVGAVVDTVVDKLTQETTFETREILVALHLAKGTSASDLAQVLASRLREAGMLIIAPRPEQGAPGGASSAQVFIERGIFVRMRLGQGLHGRITACEEAPIAISVESPQVEKVAGKLLLSATAKNMHTGDRSQHDLSMALDVEAHPAQIAAELFQLSMKEGWVAERPESLRWQPVRMKSGAALRGFSVEIEGKGDWGIYMELSPDAPDLR